MPPPHPWVYKRLVRFVSHFAEQKLFQKTDHIVKPETPEETVKEISGTRWDVFQTSKRKKVGPFEKSLKEDTFYKHGVAGTLIKGLHV